MVGEIRDSETADIAVHASLTGHLVMSTLHTNDAPTSIGRLVDMNVEPFLISSSLKGVMAQRLVRKLCSHCKKEFQPAEDILVKLGLNHKFNANDRIYKAVGCAKCFNSGYNGRVAVFELMIIDDDFQSLITKNQDASVIRKYAKEKGMKTLLEDAAKKVLEGTTTIEELLSAIIM
jgi:general secretion pathway protein E